MTTINLNQSTGSMDLKNQELLNFFNFWRKEVILTFRRHRRDFTLGSLHLAINLFKNINKKLIPYDSVLKNALFNGKR